MTQNICSRLPLLVSGHTECVCNFSRFWDICLNDLKLCSNRMQSALYNGHSWVCPRVAQIELSVLNSLWQCVLGKPFKLLALIWIIPRFVVTFSLSLSFIYFFYFLPLCSLSFAHEEDSSAQDRLFEPSKSSRFFTLEPFTPPTHPQIIPDVTNHQTQLIPHRSIADSYIQPCSPYQTYFFI